MDQPYRAILIALLAAGLAVLVVAAWYYLCRRPRDRNAPHRLGREMGLQQLNVGSQSYPIWYGGRYGDHDFALTYANLRYGRYGPKFEKTVEKVRLSLRLAIALHADNPQDVIAYFRHDRPHEPGVTPEDFEAAFDRRNTDRLSQESRDALLHFAQSYGGLRLRDRATAPAELFIAEALPAAQVVLVHDHPGYKQTPRQIYALLDALLETAQPLEVALLADG
ncbi:MAG: hypothetical protein ACK2U0_19525 [Candidatus Promineifilaceae bacterium]|jgi:hypothetical protein